MIRDWTASEKVDKISYQAEVFFIRLCMKADDYGSFHGSPKLLKSFLFPLRSDTVREADITRWMAECQKAGLILFYEVESKPYVRIENFGQRLRSKKNRFPEIPPQVAAGCGNSPPEEEDEEEEKREGAREDLKDSNLFRKPIIPSKGQVWEAFKAAGGSAEMAKSFWEKYEALGWYSDNTPIRNFKPLANKFIDSWKRNEKKEESKSGPAGSGSNHMVKL